MKYILVEMGEYFNKVTRPRLMKSIYSKVWKNGKPKNLIEYPKEIETQIKDIEKKLKDLKGIEDEEDFKFKKQKLEGEIINLKKEKEMIESILQKTPNSYYGVSHIMKYFKLEQYEDTLNNLSVSKTNLSLNKARMAPFSRFELAE